MKQAFAPLPEQTGFQSFAGVLRSWDLAPVLLGAACRMLIQSSSAIGVIAITLERAGIFTELQAMLLVCGAGPGVALAGLFLSGNLRGAPRQIVIYQGLINLVSGTLFSAVILADGWGRFGLTAGFLALLPASQCIAGVFLANMIGCAVVGIVILPFAERLLNRIEPPTAEEELSRPRFIHDEALDLPETAIDLVTREQVRALDATIALLDCIRDEAGNPPPTADPTALHGGIVALQREVREFLAELVNRQLAPAVSRAVLALERRDEHMGSLEESVNRLVSIRRETNLTGRPAELMARLVESASLLLLTARDAWTSGDPIDLAHLLKLTEDRGDLMERLSAGMQAEPLAHEAQSALFYATTLFERIVWLLRQLGLSLRESDE